MLIDAPILLFFHSKSPYSRIYSRVGRWNKHLP
nr:MAG TPA: Staygreen protein [Caudoviricetes sp.]